MATTDSEQKLIVYNPQWQGSGHDDKIFHGAKAMFDALVQISFFFTAFLLPPGIHEMPWQITQPGPSEPYVINEEVLAANADEAAYLFKSRSPRSIFTLGGDCGVDLCPINYLNKLYGGKLAVVWIDGQFDLNIPPPFSIRDLHGVNGEFHGMVLRALTHNRTNELDEREWPEFINMTVSAPIRPDQIVLVGASDYNDEEIRYAAKQDMRLVYCSKVEEQGGQPVVDILRERGLSKTYIHISANVLDRLEFPYAKCPGQEGISVKTLRRVIDDLKHAENIEIVGGSFVEVACDRGGKIKIPDGVRDIFVSLCY